MQSESQHFNFNQTQFTFLVFEKSAVDTFFKTYQPLNFRNEKLKKAFTDSLLVQNFDYVQMARLEQGTKEFSTNTDKPDTSDFNLAKNVLKATLENGGDKYFSGSLNYLFFYDCLPLKFKHKWTQSTLGHFEFNATFFALLRDKSKELDDLIYGNIGQWDEDIKSIFGEYIFNEINSETANKIRSTILNDSPLPPRRTVLETLASHGSSAMLATQFETHACYCRRWLWLNQVVDEAKSSPSNGGL
jgi:hypothetical protein